MDTINNLYQVSQKMSFSPSTKKYFIFTFLLITLLQSFNLQTHSKSKSSELRFLDEPTGALPVLRANYTQKGKESNITDLPIYVSGEDNIGSDNKAIIFIYDIAGFNGGRTRQMMDDLAARGYFVILPDLFRGKSYNGDFTFFSWLMSKSWASFNDDIVNKVYPYLEKKGFKNWGMIGACFGGWVVMQSSMETDKVIAGISYHPSLQGRMNTTMMDDMGRMVKSPQLVITTNQEPDQVKPNGIMHKELESRFKNTSMFKLYPGEDHGFVSRGDMKNATTAIAVGESVAMTYEFLDKTMPARKTTASAMISNSMYVAFMCLIITLL